MVKNKRKLGSEYENKAIEYLTKNGYNIIQKNYYCQYGEIDIIALNENYLVFIEVKFRKNDKYGFPQEAVSVSKQKRIINCAKYYCVQHKISINMPKRFDVAAILGDDILIIKNAFDIV